MTIVTRAHIDANGHINDDDVRSTLQSKSAFKSPYGLKIRLPELNDPNAILLDNSNSGTPIPHPTVRASVVGKLADSVVFTYANDAFPATHPTVYVTPTPTHIICELFTVESDIETALRYKLDDWNENYFRTYVEYVIGVAMDHWARQDFARTFIATDRGAISEHSER